MSQPAREQPPGQPEANWSAVCVLAALVLTTMPLPWGLLAAAPALAGLVLGVRAVAIRRRSKQPGGALWAGIGVFFAGYLLLTTAVMAALYDPVSAYRSCADGANTAVARQECVDTLRDRVAPSVADLVSGG